MAGSFTYHTLRAYYSVHIEEGNDVTNDDVYSNMPALPYLLECEGVVV